MGGAVNMNVDSFDLKSANIITFLVQNDNPEIKRPLIGSMGKDLVKLEYHQLIIHTGLWGIHSNDQYFDAFSLKFKTKLVIFEKQL